MAKDVTVINFWALSCGPCIVEMPDLAEFAGALPDNVQLRLSAPLQYGVHRRQECPGQVLLPADDGIGALWRCPIWRSSPELCRTTCSW